MTPHGNQVTPDPGYLCGKGEAHISRVHRYTMESMDMTSKMAFPLNLVLCLKLYINDKDPIWRMLLFLILPTVPFYLKNATETKFQYITVTNMSHM